MFRLLTAASLVLALSAPALAQDSGIIAQGCAVGRTFAAGDISVSGAFTRATLPGAASAGGYFLVTNTGGTDDTLIGASSPAAKSVSVHQMRMNGNVMEMSEVEGGLAIPAKGSVALAPSGYHLMMTGRAEPFVEGACVQLTLHFAKAGDLQVELNVGSFAQATAPGAEAAAPAASMDGMSSMEGM
jgi:copper(I)-binding protein